MKYEVFYDTLASKEISKLPQKDIITIISKIDSLENNPRPNGCKKLKGLFEDLWRIRIGEVRRVGHRKDIYD